MTVLDLFRSSLRLIRGGAGRTPGQSEQTDLLFVANAMLDAWSIERLVVYQVARDIYTFTPGVQIYTLGPGGTFNGPRPVRIERASALDVVANPSTPVEVPLEILRTIAAWQRVAVKNTGSTLPQKLYSDNAFPLAMLSFWPYPTVANQVALYVWRALAAFASVDDDVEFPPAYVDAIRYNLALRFGEELQRPVSDRVERLAIEAKSAIKRLNAPLIELRCDPAIAHAAGGYDVRTDDYRS